MSGAPADVLGPAAAHLAALQRAYEGASMVTLPDGTALVTVPSVSLPAGWSQEVTSVRFLAPVGYPLGKPDCFWADETLRLASGTLPQSANPQLLPHGQGTGLWFSWHVSSWNPNRDSLLTYVRVIERRLADAR